ncbi:hypothetical protein F1645_12040 [Novacetimonas hansenii]
MKLFGKSFRRRRLFEKRRHPKTFIVFSMICFQTLGFLCQSGLALSPAKCWRLSCRSGLPGPAMRGHAAHRLRPSYRC